MVQLFVSPPQKLLSGSASWFLCTNITVYFMLEVAGRYKIVPLLLLNVEYSCFSECVLEKSYRLSCVIESRLVPIRQTISHYVRTKFMHCVFVSILTDWWITTFEPLQFPTQFQVFQLLPLSPYYTGINWLLGIPFPILSFVLLFSKSLCLIIPRTYITFFSSLRLSKLFFFSFSRVRTSTTSDLSIQLIFTVLLLYHISKTLL